MLFKLPQDCTYEKAFKNIFYKMKYYFFIMIIFFTKQFIELIIIKILALDKGIQTISSYEMNITFTKGDDTKETIKSPSKDDDDIIATTLRYLRK